MSDDQTPATRAPQSLGGSPSASLEDFDGCARECRQAGAHTLAWGRCEHGVEPPPTLSRFETYRADDGYLSGGYETMTVEQVAEWLGEQGYTVAGPEGEVGGEAPRAAQGRTELRDAIADALGQSIAQWWQSPPRLDFAADAVMKVVGPAIERVHQMTDACDELLGRERAAHAKTAERVDIERGRGNAWASKTIHAEAAIQRVRALITCDPMEDHHDHVCPDTVLVTDVLAALGLAVLVAKPVDPEEC